MKDEQLGRAVDTNNQNIEESRAQHFRQVNTITKLTDDLAKEVEEHSQSEHALRKLEEKIENLESILDKEIADKEAVIEEKESLHEKLIDADQEIKNSHKIIRELNEKVLQYEFKHAKLASLDTAILAAKVTDLEGTIAGKDQIISLLKEQAQLSLKEITKLRQNSGQSDSRTTNTSQSNTNYAHPDTSLHPHSPQPCSSSFTPITSSLQTDTSTSNSQHATSLRPCMKVTTVDQNYNQPTTRSSQNLSTNHS